MSKVAAPMLALIVMCLAGSANAYRPGCPYWDVLWIRPFTPNGPIRTIELLWNSDPSELEAMSDETRVNLQSLGEAHFDEDQNLLSLTHVGDRTLEFTYENGLPKTSSASYDIYGDSKSTFTYTEFNSDGSPARFYETVDDWNGRTRVVHEYSDKFNTHTYRTYLEDGQVVSYVSATTDSGTPEACKTDHLFYDLGGDDVARFYDYADDDFVSLKEYWQPSGADLSLADRELTQHGFWVLERDQRGNPVWLVHAELVPYFNELRPLDPIATYLRYTYY